MPISRRSLLSAAAACIAAPCALAQSDIPEMARILTGFAAGGGADTISRRLAERLTGHYAKTVMVDVRTGAGGQIAIQALKSAPADGNTMMLIPMFALGIYPHTYKHLAYDPFVDLTAVSTATRFEYAVAVGPSVPASITTVPQLLEWFKAHKEAANFGNPAIGSTGHFLSAMLAQASGVPISHVGYRGGQPAIMDMIAGQISGVICPIGELGQYIKAKKCRVLATSGARRSRFLPDVGTLTEQGYQDMVVQEWFGIFLPGRASDAIVDKLNNGVRKAVADPGFIDAMQTMGFEPSACSPAELTAMLKADTLRWKDVVRATGFSADA